jgi:PDDEXK-like domain of unknown function (DUF3799)
MEAQTSEQTSVLPPIAFDKLIEGVSYQTYADSDGINASGLKDILRSPAHFYEHRFNRVEEKETPALLFGKLLHYAVLEPTLFKQKYVVQPKFDRRTKIGKDGYEKWMVELKPDAIIVPEDYVEKLVKMSDKIIHHPKASKLLATGVRETTLWWTDPVTGEVCKSRPDFVSEKFGIIDLKTTTDARYEAFQYQIRKLQYHVQAAHYLYGARCTGVCRSDAFTFIAIEKDPPYEMAVWPAGASILAHGEREREKAMAKFAQCKKTKVWPGYNPDARLIEFPDWFMANELYEEEGEVSQ